MNAHDAMSSKSTATEMQIARLLALLRIAPRHTHELRVLGISHPAGRVQDSSARVTTVDADGYSHKRVALYHLIAEPEDDVTCAAQGSQTAAKCRKSAASGTSENLMFAQQSAAKSQARLHAAEGDSE